MPILVITYLLLTCSPSKPPKAVSLLSFICVYFPHASAQVQPQPPDVTELLRLVEELCERESRLKTEILKQKLLREYVAILPILENEIVTKDAEIEKVAKKIEGLEAENERLMTELQELKEKMEEERRESERKVKEMDAEMAKMASERRESKGLLSETGESDELSLSQRFQGLIDLIVRQTTTSAEKGRVVHK